MPVTALTPIQLQRWFTRRWGKVAAATWTARLTPLSKLGLLLNDVQPNAFASDDLGVELL